MLAVDVNVAIVVSSGCRAWFDGGSQLAGVGIWRDWFVSIGSTVEPPDLPCQIGVLS